MFSRQPSWPLSTLGTNLPPREFVSRKGLEWFAERTLEEKEEFFFIFSRLLREAFRAG